MKLTKEQCEHLRTLPIGKMVNDLLDTIADLEAKLAAVPIEATDKEFDIWLSLKKHVHELEAKLAAETERSIQLEGEIAEVCPEDRSLKSHFAFMSARIVDRDVLIEKLESLISAAADHERLEVAAKLREAAEICKKHAAFCKDEAHKGGDFEHLMTRVEEAVYLGGRIESLIPPDTASLWDRKLAEARLEEVDLWHAEKWCDGVEPCEGCNRIAELRRAVGKGEADAKE